MTRPLPVIARSPCDEAIQTVSADRFLDCFATLAMTEYVVSCVALYLHGLRSRSEEYTAYSSLPRVIAMDASVLVRVHSMLSRR
ncbi:hypothetical protein C7U65_11205 [Bradyrhizobium sp. WBAH23]|nr:hypothetical protein [Bradyrhizobium sp. WBAH30]MDD1545651.1 hypothetical protein [Bradyrhizobium sp. WBAH41]MDD1556188.1 hypothetical protein [Bradyrhizobium sp. WBAH23]MDD1561971.1 hypothetical protein [Bradyrhizobium sp. WBAH33]MDD1594178.1 hypothetical protein [Bradyrhizobium sp. WBAH42]NRB85028.1 hypothetical protein [Bradyrhizobium sp. WBAH10]